MAVRATGHGLAAPPHGDGHGRGHRLGGVDGRLRPRGGARGVALALPPDERPDDAQPPGRRARADPGGPGPGAGAGGSGGRASAHRRRVRPPRAGRPGAARLPRGRPRTPSGFTGGARSGSPKSRPVFGDGRWLRLEPRTGRAAVAAPVDLGGIGKGLALRWTFGRIARLLALADGGRGALLEAGGDLVATGSGAAGRAVARRDRGPGRRGGAGGHRRPRGCRCDLVDPGPRLADRRRQGRPPPARPADGRAGRCRPGLRHGRGTRPRLGGGLVEGVLPRGRARHRVNGRGRSASPPGGSRPTGAST